MNEGRKQLIPWSFFNYKRIPARWPFFDYKRIPADEMTGIMAMDDELSSTTTYWLWPLTRQIDDLYGSLN